MKVLVVEDQPIIAESIALAVEDLGYEVMGPAYSLIAALKLVDNETPDIALVDIDLDRPNEGLTVAERLSPLQTSVIFISGKPEIACRNANLAIGYISKPFAPHTLAEIVEVVDAMRKGGAPPPPPVPSEFHRF